MKKNVLFLFIFMFVVGFVSGQTINQNILPLTKMALYENLLGKLQKKYILHPDEIAQGEHVAAVYYRGTRKKVLEWYYTTKWKHERREAPPHKRKREDFTVHGTLHLVGSDKK